MIETAFIHSFKSSFIFLMSILCCVLILFYNFFTILVQVQNILRS